MPKYDVDVGGKTYEVDAPDANTAWHWANVTHIDNDPISQGARNINKETLSGRIISAFPETARGVADLLTGATSVTRGALNRASDAYDLVRDRSLDNRSNLGNRILPPTEGDSVLKTVGEIADPAAWAIGGAVAKQLPYSKVLGNGIAEGAKAIGKNALSGAQTGSILGFLSDNGDPIAPMVTGAAMNVAVPGVIAGLTGAGKIARNIAGPMEGRVGRLFNDVAGDQRQAVIDAMLNAKSRVPGERLTAGQAALEGGSPQFSALQEIINAKAPEKYLDPIAGIGARNEAARGALLDRFAGDVNSLGLQRVLRNAETKPIRDAALANANLAGVKAPELQGRLSGQQEAVVSALQDTGKFQSFGAQSANRAAQGKPGFISNADRAAEAKSAVADTAEILANRKAQAGLTQYQLDSLAAHGHYPLETKPISNAIDALINNPENKGISLNAKVLGAVKDKIDSLANADGVIDSRTLYNIRKTEIGDIVENLTKDADASTKRRAAGLLTSIKDDIDKAIEGAGGTGWSDYLKRYSELSGPIDNARSGAAIRNALSDSLGTVERPKAFASAVKNPKNPVTNAQQQSAIDAVTESLVRDEKYAQSARAGMKSASERINIDTPKIGSAGILNPKINATRAVINAISGHATNKTLGEMAKYMDNPQEVARLMQAATPAQRSAIVDALIKHGISTGITNAAVQGDSK